MRRVRALLIAFGTDARNAGIELIPALICFGLAEPNCKDRCRQAEKVKLMRGENEAHEFRASLTRPGGQGFRAGERNKRKHWVGTGIRRRSCAMHPVSRQATQSEQATWKWIGSGALREHARAGRPVTSERQRTHQVASQSRDNWSCRNVRIPAARPDKNP